MKERYLGLSAAILCLTACQPAKEVASTSSGREAVVQSAEHPYRNIASPNITQNDKITSGEINRFMFTDWAGPDLPVWIYVSRKVDIEKAPIIFMLHGAKRDPHRYLREWVKPAQENGLIVIAPEFSKADFPKSAGYNLGNVFREEGKGLQDEAVWSFSAIEPIFDVVRQAVGSEKQKYSIYGHSAGSQFVHRFLYYKPNARVNRYITANAGWYTTPDLEEVYPYGLKGSGISEEMLKTALSKDVLILLGDKDNDPNHESLRRTEEAMRQGPHRFARGLSYFETGKQQAKNFGVDYGWSIKVVPGVAHSNGLMAQAAAPTVK